MLESTMPGRRSHRLHLGMTTPEEVAAYIEAFLMAFSQGSADAFGRLSKVRSELKELLWTHPSGSQAGIADALEYLNQLLHDNYGITLEAASSEDAEPWQQQPASHAALNTAQLLPAVPAGGMQHQATQTDPGSMTLPLKYRSVVETPAPEQCSHTVRDQPATLSRADPGTADGQQSSPVAVSPGMGLEAPRRLTDIPAAVPTRAALSKDKTQQALVAAPAVPDPQADSAPAQQMHRKVEAFPAREVPDSLHLDTSTLQELTALPSAHGRIPLSLKSPLPMAAARPAKDRGTGRLPGALMRPARSAKPSPAKEAARATNRQPPFSRASDMGSRAAGNQDAVGNRRLGHPATRKQLLFNIADQHASGTDPSQKEAPGRLQGPQAIRQVPSQQAKPLSMQGPHHKTTEAHILHASSDSDTPQSAAARLPEPVQQGPSVNPLFDRSHDSAALQAAETRSAQPAGSPLEAAAVAAQGADMMHASAADQETALVKADAAGQPQQLQQASAASVHGAPQWVEQMTAMTAAMAASASAASAAGPARAATQFQHGSTQFNHCHFTQSMQPPARLHDKASHVGALVQPPIEDESSHGSKALLAALTRSNDRPEPAEDEGLHAVAGSASDQPSASVSPGAKAHMGTAAARHSELSRERKKTVRFKPAQLAAKHSSSLPSLARDPGSARPMHAPDRPPAQPKRNAPQKSKPRNKTDNQEVNARDTDAVPAQPAFDYAKALAALDSQGAGPLQQLHSTGLQGREAAFEPLAALLLHPETLRHLGADSHGATNADDERPILAPYTAGAHKGGQTSAPHHEGAASSGPSAVQLQLAERIADAVAARLQHHAVQSSAQQPHRDLSSVQVCCDTTLPHAAPQAASVKGKAAGALSQQMRGDAPEDPSVHLKERVVHRQACEEDFLAALLQGSPGKPSHAGQPDRPQACEQDFLAALLLTPGTSGRTSHAASPGLMHKDSCSNADGRAAAVEKLADSRVQPWTSQWAGKLTQQQMETAVQEVIAEELQALFKDTRCKPEQLPQVCSHIAALSLHACQRSSADILHAARAQVPKWSSESDSSASVQAKTLSEGGKGKVQLPAQPLTSASVHGPEADSSGQGSALQSPIKEAFMHAVLQSLADICKEGLGDSPQASSDQKPSTASAAQGSTRLSGGASTGERREGLAEDIDLLRGHPEARTQPVQRAPPRAVQKRQVKASQDRRAAPVGQKGPRGAAPLVRLKAALRKPKLLARSAAPLQTAAHAATSGGSPPEAHSHVQAQGGLSQGMRERQSNAAGGPSAPASTAPALARSSSWHTEQDENTHVSSYSMSASDGGGEVMPAAELAKSLPPVVQPASAAEAPEPRPLKIRGSIPLRLHGMDHQGSAVRGLGHLEALPQGQPHVRSGPQHKHPSRQRHRKATQPCTPSPSTGPSCYSADETEQQYRRQKALAAEKQEHAAKHARPVIREGTAERRRRLIAEAGLTDSLLFSSDSRSSSESEDSAPSHRSSSDGSSEASEQPLGSASDLSSISSAASTPRACLDQRVSEQVVSTSSGTSARASMQREAFSSARNGSTKAESDAADLLSSESSTSQAASASAYVEEQSLHTQGGRRFASIGRSACLSGAPKSREQLKTAWDSPLDAYAQAQGDKHAAWGASQHLQERLASVRTLAFSMG